MRKKIFTFLLALAASVGVSWATVITWDQSKLSSMAMNIESGSGIKASDGIEVTAVSTGEFVRFCYGGAIEIGNGEGSGGGYLTFTSSVGNIAQIDINHSGAGEWRNANGDWISPYYENFEGGIFRWSGTPAASITLTGDAPRHIENITSIEFTIEDGGGSTPTPTPSATGGIFANCYDCQRYPDYPTNSGYCNLFYFDDPRVGNENPSGPWKLEFVEYYNPSNSSTEYGSIVDESVANQYGKSPEQMEVYRLYQWQNGAYQPVAYGVLYAYANESNSVEHAAFFEANGHYGCYLTGNTHSYNDDIYITFNEDASTGFADLHPAPTPAVDPAEPVTVVFEANNNQKEVEVTLPHTFACDFLNGQGELDGIIQELYALQYGGYCQAMTVPTATGNEAVTASKDGNNHYIAISEAFEGTATVTGNYVKFLDTEQMGNTPVDYTLSISVQGSTPEPSETTVTWDLSDMASMGTQGGYFKAKGITLMAYGVDNGMSGDGSYGGAFFGGPFVFTTSLGKFTKIEVTNSYLYEQPAFSGDGWTLDGTNAVWEGTPAALVSLVSNFGGITQIKFTIDPNTSTPANSCGDGLTGLLTTACSRFRTTASVPALWTTMMILSLCRGTVRTLPR